MEEVILEVNRVNKSYYKKEGLFRKQRSDHILKDISMDLKKGEIVGILGESGCGKSTLAKSIVRLVDIDDGEILFEGKNIANMPEKDFHSYRQDIQYISQNPFTSFNNKMKIKDILLEAMNEYKIGTMEERMKTIKELLEDCGLPTDSLDRYPYEFSGGQLQRLSIARALTLNPKLILADEIVSALDISIQSRILDLLLKLQKEREVSIIFISHDLAVIRKISDRIYVMRHGEMIDEGDPNHIFKESKVEYTKKLVDSIPVFPY